MIKKVVKITTLSESGPKADRDYWLSRPPEERIEAVELLRRQVHGNTARLQRVARVRSLINHSKTESY